MKKLFAVFIDSAYIRNAELALTKSLDDEELDDAPSSEDTDWVETDPTPYVGSVWANSEEEAVNIAAEKWRYDSRIICADDMKFLAASAVIENGPKPVRDFVKATNVWDAKMRELIKKYHAAASSVDQKQIDAEIRANVYYEALLPGIAAALCLEAGTAPDDFAIFGPYQLGVAYCDIVIRLDSPLWIRVLLREKEDGPSTPYVEPLLTKGRGDYLAYETGAVAAEDSLRYYPNAVHIPREVKPLPAAPADVVPLMRDPYDEATLAMGWCGPMPTKEDIAEYKNNHNQ